MTKTLADMTPEERAECQWMQGDLKGNRIIIGALADGGVNYIKQDGKAYWDSLESGAGEIVPLPDLPRMKWPGNEPEETHFDDFPDEIKRVIKDSIEDYKAGKFVDFSLDKEKPSSPRPKNVPVGEPWIVEVNGQAAIGYRNDPEHSIPWQVTYRDYAGVGYIEDADVTLVARLVPETTKQDNAPEFDPAYAYTDRAGDIWRYMFGGWRRKGLVVSFPHSTPPAEGGPYTRIEKNTNHDH